MRHFERSRSGVLVLVVLALLNGCSSERPTESGPGGAVRQFYDLLNRGDLTAAMGLYSAEARTAIGDATGSDSPFGDWAEQETKARSVADVRIVSTIEREDGSGADVQFEVRYRDGSAVTRQVSLVQEGGGWRLGFIS